MNITVQNSSRTVFQLAPTPIATPGAEGSVHRIIAPAYHSKYCAKIFHLPKRTSTKRAKVEFMIKNKPASLTGHNHVLCWPDEMLFDTSGQFVGFLMPLAFDGSEKLYELTILKGSLKNNFSWAKFDRATTLGFNNRYKICCNIASAIHTIHSSNKYTIVDYKPQNILITDQGKISITDIDSFQIASSGQVIHFAEVVTPEYAPIESKTLNPTEVFIPNTWDRFSLAVSFYEILFGIHPYAATGSGQYSNMGTIGEKIKSGLFVHGAQKTSLSFIPPIHSGFSSLPPQLKSLFIRAFENGNKNPEERPSAYEWGAALYLIVSSH
jgi:DNA-binding helix-hairpin-helix protein with protein kinase domain